MKLSILIPTLQDRKEKLDRLRKKLAKLTNGNNNIEVLINSDNGEQTTGEKRNSLLFKARGDYVVFIDDDDEIENNYISSIYPIICGPVSYDVVNFTVMYDNKKIIRPVYYSIKYDRDKNLPDKFIRLPNHLMVVKREHATNTLFPNLTFGEDSDYARRLKSKLKKEYCINKILYVYKDYK